MVRCLAAHCWPVPAVILLVVLGGPASGVSGPRGDGRSNKGTSAQQAPATGSAVQATYAVFLRGTRIGNEEVKVSATAAEVLISATTRLAPPLGLTIRRAEARYTPTWQPLELVLEGTFRDQAIDLRTTFSGTTASSHFLTGGKYLDKTDTVAADTVILPNNFYGAYAALGPRLADATEGTRIRVYVAPQAEIDLVVRGADTKRFQTPGRSFDVRQYQVTYANPGAPMDGEIWFEPDGRFVRLSLPSVGVDVVRDDIAAVSARLQTFQRRGDEDVRIRSTGFVLAGTISKPAGKPAPDGKSPRLPAVVLVPGSGSQDRDEVVAGIPIFGQLAAALADAGFLVVRYDKRGVGLSGGRLESATLDDFADDLRAAVTFLADRKDVDHARIAVVGHSEGAWVSMLAASRDKRIWRLVLMAGAAGTGAELILEQQQHLLGRTQMSEADKLARVELQKRIQQAVLTGSGWDGIPTDLRKQAETPWFASLLRFDAAAVMPRVRQQVLVVQGALDTQVPPGHGERLVELSRKRKSGGAATLVVIPGVNHLFVPATTGEVDEYPTLKEKSITPELPDAIAGWLGK